MKIIKSVILIVATLFFSVSLFAAEQEKQHMGELMQIQPVSVEHAQRLAEIQAQISENRNKLDRENNIIVSIEENGSPFEDLGFVVEFKDGGIWDSAVEMEYWSGLGYTLETDKMLKDLYFSLKTQSQAELFDGSAAGSYLITTETEDGEDRINTFMYFEDAILELPFSSLSVWANNELYPYNVVKDEDNRFSFDRLLLDMQEVHRNSDNIVDLTFDVLTGKYSFTSAQGLTALQ